jgi:hypothetical protein
VAGDAATLTIFGPDRWPEAELPDLVEIEDGGVLVDEVFVPPPPRTTEVAVLTAVDVADFPGELVSEV